MPISVMVCKLIILVMLAIECSAIMFGTPVNEDLWEVFVRGFKIAFMCFIFWMAGALPF